MLHAKEKLKQTVCLVISVINDFSKMMNAFAMKDTMIKVIIQYVSNVFMHGLIVILNINLSLTCNGDNIDNCLTCDESNNFRIFEEVNSTCLCKGGYWN